MSKSAPVLSHEDRLRGIELGNRIRFARARIRAEVKALPRAKGKEALARYVELPLIEEVVTWKVAKVLTYLRGYGPYYVRRRMTKLRISDAKTIGGLSDRQRHDLLVWLLEDS